MAFFRRLYQFDFMGHKVWWFAISGALIALSLVSLAVKGLDFGLEFREGTRITVSFEQPPALGDLREAVSEAGYANAQIQQTAGVTASSFDGFQIQVPMLSDDQQVALREALDERFTIESSDGKQVWGVETVSASFGRQVVSSSLKAIAVALLLILAYVTFRFQWKYAVGAISAVVHDTLIVVGIYSLTGREVTTATIAALLTIMGYSLYDNVIVFDRVRENEGKLGRMTYAAMVNESLWEMLTRSLNTTLISLLPVICLLLFGGETLKDFAFALLVGILLGAYSTFFVSAPVLTILKEREPRYKKLKAAARAESA
jgi:SecD/SecF fusion protein